MKTKSLLFLLMSCYFLMTCDDGFLETVQPMEIEELEGEIAYPASYRPSDFEFNPTQFYTYQLDSFSQITISSGDYTLVDSVLFADFYDENNEEGFGEPFVIRELDLLNDTLVHLRMESQYITMPIDSNFTYRMENNELLIDFFGGTFSFAQSPDFTELRLCYQIFGFNYYSDFNMRRILGGFDGGECEFATNAEELLFSVVDNSEGITFQRNDTFIVNYSYYRMELVE